MDAPVARIAATSQTFVGLVLGTSIARVVEAANAQMLMHPNRTLEAKKT